MNRKPALLLLFCLLIALALIFYPKSTSAEIATVRDWIGFFPAGTSGTVTCGADFKVDCDTKAAAVASDVNPPFVDGRSWVYTSSCTQTPGAIPSLERKDASACSFTLNPVPPDGNYEFRMYANDQQNADALISISRRVSVGASYATTQDCGGGVFSRAEGLVTTPNLVGKFSTSGKCVEDPKTVFNPYTAKLTSYQELKSRYFDQAKTSGSVKKIVFEGDTGEGWLSGCLTNATCPLDSRNRTQDSNASQLLIYVTGNVGFANGQLTGSKTGLVFIDGNLNIDPNPPGNQYIYGDANAGLVLIVKGDVNIAPEITRIDAVIIAGGTIYTAGAGCAKSNITGVSPLLVNGTLVSLSSGRKIVFCRSLGTGNNNPAEIIEQQPKYLVLLRNILSETAQRWAELTTEPADSPCNTYTEATDCTAWITQPNTCSANNKSRTCNKTTLDGRRDTYCILNTVTESQIFDYCNTADGYYCSVPGGPGECLLNCTEDRVCNGPGEGTCEPRNANACGVNAGTRQCVWTTNPASTPTTNCNQEPVNNQAAQCDVTCGSGLVCSSSTGTGTCLPNCNTATCTNWSTPTNYCVANNSSRTCTNNTYVSGSTNTSSCNQSTYTEYQTVSCSANYYCNASNICERLNCNADPVNSGTCTVPGNTCFTNNGTQAQIFTTLNGSTTCNQVAAPGISCTSPNCSWSYTCSGNPTTAMCVYGDGPSVTANYNCIQTPNRPDELTVSWANLPNPTGYTFLNIGGVFGSPGSKNISGLTSTTVPNGFSGTLRPSTQYFAQMGGPLSTYTYFTTLPACP